VIETVFRSDDVAAPDRLESWQDHLSRTHTPMRVVETVAQGFEAGQQVLVLGETVVSVSTHLPMKIERRGRLISGTDADLIYLALPLRGTMKVDQTDRASVHAGADFVFHDSRTPVVVRTTPTLGHETYHGLAVQFPRTLLPLTTCESERLFARSLPANTGVGALVAQILTRMSADADSYRPDDARRLGRVVIELTTTLFAHVLDVEDPPETHREALAFRVKHFIRDHLRDPELTPARSSRRPGSPPRTTSRPATCTGCSRATTPRSPPPSVISGWKACAAISSTRRYAACPSTPSRHGGATRAPPSSAGPSAPPSALPPGITACSTSNGRR